MFGLVWGARSGRERLFRVRGGDDAKAWVVWKSGRKEDGCLLSLSHIP